jgi:hypothetical protein
MHTLVLLGAGASFGSERDGVARPPLGENLFKEMAAAGSLASELPEDLANIFKSNFEIGMNALCEQFSKNIQRFQRELAEFLSSYSPTHDSLYIKLIKKMGWKNTVYASLNYDLLFEQAAESLGIGSVYGNLKRAGHARLIKPHGSSNFWPDMPAERITRSVFGAGGGDVYRGPVKPIGLMETRERCRVDDSLSPAMSLYAKGKTVQICSDYVSWHQEQFVKACRSAKRIVIVGVKVVPEDTHIWGPISRCSSRINYFGNHDDKTLFELWQDSVKRKGAYFIEGYFDKALSYL